MQTVYYPQSSENNFLVYVCDDSGSVTTLTNLTAIPSYDMQRCDFVAKSYPVILEDVMGFDDEDNEYDAVFLCIDRDTSELVAVYLTSEVTVEAMAYYFEHVAIVTKFIVVDEIPRQVDHMAPHEGFYRIGDASLQLLLRKEDSLLFRAFPIVEYKGSMYALYVYYENNPSKVTVFVADITDTSTKYVVEERNAAIDEVFSSRGRSRYYYHDNRSVVKIIETTLERNEVDYL
jgi:hypothetical protein